MSLLLLFSDQVTAGPSGFPAVKVLLEKVQPTFVDISADLVSADVSRGRQRELDRYQAGTASITLRNDLRQYDPNHTANIKPMRAVQVTATWAGTTYPIFTGYVDRWEQQPDEPNNAAARLTATDAFKVLERARLASSAYAVEVLADSPLRWWRLGEPVGSTLFLDETGDTDLTISGPPNLSVDGLVSRDAGAAMEVTAGGQGGYAAKPGQAYTAFSVEMLFRSVATDDGALFAETNDIGTQGFVLRVDGDPDTFGYIVATSAGSTGLVSTGVTCDDDATHHVVLTWDGTNVRSYVDGVLKTTTALAGTIPATTASIVALAGYSIGPNTVAGAVGTYDEVAVYTTALSAARILAHYQAVATPWDNDTPGQRAARVLDAAGWGPARDLHTGSASLQPAELDMSALEHLQKVAETELGNLYTRADGVIVLEGRTDRANQASLGTFTDTRGSSPAIAAYQPEYGDDLIRNDVTVSRLDGTAQNVQDQASIDEFLINSYTLDGLYHDDDLTSRHLAELIVSEYAQPIQRISGLTVRPRANTATLFPQVLGRELTDKVTVATTPQGVGSQFSQVSVVEGITHRVVPKDWETVWTLSPAFAGTGCFLQLDAGPCGLDTARLYV